MRHSCPAALLRLIYLSSSILMLSTGFSAIAAENAKASTDPNFPHKDTLEASQFRGRLVYENYCVKCHGVNFDGRGRASHIYNPPPANLRTSDKNDKYKELIIRRGGVAMGRSQFMPPWGDELTDEQITDVVNFLSTVKDKG